MILCSGNSDCDNGLTCQSKQLTNANGAAQEQKFCGECSEDGHCSRTYGPNVPDADLKCDAGRCRQKCQVNETDQSVDPSDCTERPQYYEFTCENSVCVSI